MRRLSTAKDWRTERGRTDGSEPSEQSKSFWDGVTSIADVQKSSRTNFSVDNKLPHRARDVTRHEKVVTADALLFEPFSSCVVYVMLKSFFSDVVFSPQQLRDGLFIQPMDGNSPGTVFAVRRCFMLLLKFLSQSDS